MAESTAKIDIASEPYNRAKSEFMRRDIGKIQKGATVVKDVSGDVAEVSGYTSAILGVTGALAGNSTCLAGSALSARVSTIAGGVNVAADIVDGGDFDENNAVAYAISSVSGGVVDGTAVTILGRRIYNDVKPAVDAVSKVLGETVTQLGRNASKNDVKKNNGGDGPKTYNRAERSNVSMPTGERESTAVSIDETDDVSS